jgi:MFS family permease
MVLLAAAAMFMAQLDGAVLAIALPRIASDFGLPTISLSLAVTIYLIMLVAILPVSGWAADRFGPKRVFLVATAAFAVFSLGCALAESFWPFIISRALQGASAALLTPVGRLILLRQTSKEELVDALAITAMPMLVAPTLGPSLAGFIIDYGRWEYIFLLNLPISALIFIVGSKRILEMERDPELPLDVVGALLLSGGLIALLTGIDRLVDGLDAALPWSLIAIGTVLLGAALRHIRASPSPIVALDAMRSAAFRTAAVVPVRSSACRRGP